MYPMTRVLRQEEHQRAPRGAGEESCVGLHTAIGEAIGSSVYDAVRAGAERWSADMKEWASA